MSLMEEYAREVSRIERMKLDKARDILYRIVEHWNHSDFYIGDNESEDIKDTIRAEFVDLINEAKSILKETV